MDERTLHTLRVMAWERAKGELRGMMHTYYDGRCAPMNEAIERLVKEVESQGLLDLDE